MELSPHINRPIGLIEATWGGTPVEAWSSPDARNACSQRRKRYHFKFLHKSILSMECMGKRVNFLIFFNQSKFPCLNLGVFDKLGLVTRNTDYIGCKQQMRIFSLFIISVIRFMKIL